MRHPIETISKIKKLREGGATLTEIIAKTGLPKTTIHYHIQKITKSDYLKQRLAEINLAKFKNIADHRRGKSFKTWSFVRPTEWSPQFVNLLAHFMFDGTMNRTSFTYNNRSHALIRQVVDEMQTLLNVFDYKFYEDRRNGVLRIGYFNVELATFLNQKVIEMLYYISDATREEKIAFLKAFYDDEGNVSFKGHKKAVRGYQYTGAILDLVQKLLRELNIDSRVSYQFHEICISRKAEIIRFAEIINFSEGLCVNGARSNSIWKESLEKREILRRLIADYQTAG